MLFAGVPVQYYDVCDVMHAAVEVEDDTAADSDDGSTGGGRRDRGGSAKKTVAPLKIKINKKKKKRRGSDVRFSLRFLVIFMTQHVIRNSRYSENCVLFSCDCHC